MAVTRCDRDVIGVCFTSRKAAVVFVLCPAGARATAVSCIVCPRRRKGPACCDIKVGVGDVLTDRLLFS